MYARIDTGGAVRRAVTAICARRLLSGVNKKAASLCPLAKRSIGHNVATIAEMFLQETIAVWILRKPTKERDKRGLELCSSSSTS